MQVHEARRLSCRVCKQPADKKGEKKKTESRSESVAVCQGHITLGEFSRRRPDDEEVMMSSSLQGVCVTAHSDGGSVSDWAAVRCLGP